MNLLQGGAITYGPPQFSEVLLAVERFSAESEDPKAGIVFFFGYANNTVRTIRKIGRTSLISQFRL
jgi:hypothetical protein